MVKHFIVLGSSYKTGKRIALDYCTANSYDNISKLLENIKSSNMKQVAIATHTITTKTNKWNDVVKLDPFFEKIQLVKTEDEFFNHLLEDKEITALDIANYIITRTKCTHTRLEKLLYFCYADYLCKYKEKLFNDKIYAFKYGPVISTIYEKYKGNNQAIIKEISKKYDLPIRSRIMNSHNGIKKINSIDNSLRKYAKLDTDTLIGLTHKKNTPWAHSDEGESSYRIISDKDILKYHKYEEV